MLKQPRESKRVNKQRKKSREIPRTFTSRVSSKNINKENKRSRRDITNSDERSVNNDEQNRESQRDTRKIHQMRVIKGT